EHVPLEPAPSAPETPASSVTAAAGQDSADVHPFDDLVAQLSSGHIDVGHFAEAMKQQDAPDVADVLEDLQNDEEPAEGIVGMDARGAADAIAEMEMPLAVRVIEDLVDEDNAAYAGQLIQLMAPDDAVDLLQELEESHRENLLKGMPYLQAGKLRRLIRYDKE